MFHVVDLGAPLGTEIRGLATVAPDRKVEAFEATAVPLWSVIRSAVPIVGLVGRRVSQVDDAFFCKVRQEVHKLLDVDALLAHLGKEGLA